MASAAVVGGVACLAMFLGTEPPVESTARVESPGLDDWRIVDASLLSEPQLAIYKYSVIPGGARNEQELADAIDRDPVVARQYGSLNTATMHPETVKTDLWAYVSYRIHDRVYWTGHKVHIRSGETILSDGTTQLRARCGNCISMEPLLPTSGDEPDPLEFDALIGDEPPLPSRSLTGLMTPFPVGGIPPIDASRFGVPPFPVGVGGGGGAVGVPESHSGTTPTEVSVTPDSDVPVVSLPITPPAGGQPPSTDVISPPGGGPGNDAPPDRDTPFVVPLNPPLNDGNVPPTLRETPSQPVPVPEAGTFVLFGSGAALLARRRFLKR